MEEAVSKFVRLVLLADLLWCLVVIVFAIALVLIVRWLMSDWFDWGDDADF